MKKTKLYLYLFFFSVSVISICQSRQNFYTLGNFELENGSIILNCKIGYRIYGKLNEEKTNVILYPTWFGGISEHIAKVIGRGKLIDTTLYYVIAVDAFGNGISSSPSNNTKQPKDNFPVFTIRDMVNAQYILLTEGLNLQHLFCIIGGSMGSFQTFEWLVNYPDFMDKAIAYVCSPQRSTYDLLLSHAQLQVIETGKRYNIPDNEIMRLLQMMQESIVRTPNYYVENWTLQDLEKHLSDCDGEHSPTFTLENWERQLQACTNHNIFEPFDGATEEAAKVIKAEVLIIVALNDNIVHPKSALEFAELINAKTLILDSDCGHLSVGCEMEKVSKVISSFLVQ